MLKDNSISPGGGEQSTGGTTCGEEFFGSYDPKIRPRPARSHAALDHAFDFMNRGWFGGLRRPASSRCSVRGALSDISRLIVSSTSPTHPRYRQNRPILSTSGRN